VKPVLHRSIIFWTGILLMAFIAWVWWQSMNGITMLRGSRLKVFNSSAGLCLTWHKGWHWDTELEWVHTPGKFKLVESKEFLLSFEAAKTGEGVNPFGKVCWAAAELKSTVFIPYWLILSGCVSLWLGLLLWRARRSGKTPKVEAAFS
jgi:hypothetical protein